MRALSRDKEVKRLIRALVLSERFHFYILICRTTRVANAVLMFVLEEVARIRPLRNRRLDPYKMHSDTWEPIARETLASQVLEPLVHPIPGDAARDIVHIIDASRSAAIDHDAWSWMFQRMNEARNLIDRELQGELILCIPARLELVFAQSAPDFWSIRSSAEFRVTVELSGGESEPADRARRRIAPVFLQYEPKEEVTAEQILDARTNPSDPRDLYSKYRSRAAWLHQSARADALQARQLRAQDKLAAALKKLDELVTIRRDLVDLSPPSLSRSRPSNDPDQARRDLADALVERGEVWHDNGKLDLALADYEEALTIRHDLPLCREKQPDVEQPDWLRALALNKVRVGDVVHDQGDQKRALEHYEEGRKGVCRLLDRVPGRQGRSSRGRSILQGIRRLLGHDPELPEWLRDLLERNPEQPEWFRDLSVILERMGDVHDADGAWDRALTFHAGALAISRLLLEAYPDQPAWLDELSAGLDRTGDTYRARGDLDRALAAYEEGLQAMRRLVQSAREQPEWVRDLSVSLINIGDVQRVRGDLTRARTAYEEALQLRRGLVERDPERPERLHDVAVGLSRIGDTHRVSGDYEQALASYQEALTILGRLLQRNLKWPEWLRDQSVILDRVAEVERLLEVKRLAEVERLARG